MASPPSNRRRRGLESGAGRSYPLRVNPRIAVTGIGLVSRVGRLDGTWRAALEGRDGAVALAGAAAKAAAVGRAAVVPHALRDPTLTPQARKCDRGVQLALAAAGEAWT